MPRRKPRRETAKRDTSRKSGRAKAGRRLVDVDYERRPNVRIDIKDRRIKRDRIIRYRIYKAD